MKTIFTLVIFTVFTVSGFAQTWNQEATIPSDGTFNRGGSFSIGSKGYVFGAHYEQKVYSYDTLSKRWTKMNPYPSAATDGVVGCSLNGFGYAGTGVLSTSFTNAFFKYDPSTDTWTSLPDFPGAARAYAVMFALDGKIYLG